MQTSAAAPAPAPSDPSSLSARLRPCSRAQSVLRALLGVTLFLAAACAPPEEAGSAEPAAAELEIAGGATTTRDDAALAALDAAIANTERPERDRARDVHRKPAEVLAFCEVEPGAHVVDAMAGSGYYTEILARLVGPEGRVFGHNSPFVLDRFAEQPWSERLARLPDNVVRIDAEPEELAVPEPVDVVLLNRFYHDFYWQEVDRAAFNAAVWNALEPGGVYCVVDHHAEEGSGARDVQRLHRVDAAMVRKEIEAAGFEFDASSDVLANPDDDRSWNVFADEGARRDQTDRFVYRFRKPGEPASGR